MNSEIQQYTEFLENNKSIYKKIICYKLRGVLYLKEELFIDAINDFTKSINLLKKINKWKGKVNVYMRVFYHAIPLALVEKTFFPFLNSL